MIDSYPFEYDELFQLNLLIWLVWSSNASGIKPVFREDGYQLEAIGPTCRPTIQVHAIANQAGLPFKTEANPDILLRHSQRNLFLPIECKLNSFGPDSTAAEQANVLLSVEGSQIAASIGLPQAQNWQSFLIYALNADHDRMLETLQELTLRLKSANLSVVSSGTLGIIVSSDGIDLQTLPCDVVPVSALRSERPNIIRVMELEDGGDPRPFYLVPVDPSIKLNNPFGIRLIEERIRTAVMSVFGSKLDMGAFEVTEDEFMREVLEIWDYWKDRQARTGLLKQATRPYINKILKEMRDRGAKITQKQRTIQFSEITPTIAQNIRAYLMSASFRRGDINFEENLRQLSFDDLPNGWFVE